MRSYPTKICKSNFVYTIKFNYKINLTNTRIYLKPLRCISMD